MLSYHLVAILATSAGAATKLTLPYPASLRPTTSLYVISSQGRSPAELVCLDTFAGLLARDTPTVYRVADANWVSAADSTAAWLREMRSNGIEVNTSLINASVPLFVASVTAAASKSLPGYVLADGATQCNEHNGQSPELLTADRMCGRGRVWSWKSADSISAGLTMAAAADGLVVVSDPQLAAELEAVGVTQRADVRTQTVGDVLKLPGVLGNLSTSIYIWQVRACPRNRTLSRGQPCLLITCCALVTTAPHLLPCVAQDAAKASFLGDYGVFARAATLPFGAEPSAQATLLRARPDTSVLGAAFGWGPENAYVSTCNAAGVYVHASDYCTNLAALSNARVAVPAYTSPASPTPPLSSSLSSSTSSSSSSSSSSSLRGVGASVADRTIGDARRFFRVATTTAADAAASAATTMNTTSTTANAQEGPPPRSKPSTAPPNAAAAAAAAAADKKHTVAFVMSDGDNLQWILGPWTTDERWWGASERGSVPLGWTLSPAIGHVASPALALIAKGRTDEDELVGAPSGVGYVFPQTWPKDTGEDEDEAPDVPLAAEVSQVSQVSQAPQAPRGPQVAEEVDVVEEVEQVVGGGAADGVRREAGSATSNFVAATADGMAAAGMRLLNVLGQNDDAPDGALLSAMLDSDSVDGALYYGWGGGYSSLGGATPPKKKNSCTHGLARTLLPLLLSRECRFAPRAPTQTARRSADSPTTRDLTRSHEISRYLKRSHEISRDLTRFGSAFAVAVAVAPLSPPSVPAPWASSAGRMWRMKNQKLVVSGRYSLWGNGTSGPMLGVQPLIDALKSMPRDASSADGYSVVPVHAWSHTYADVVAVAAALASDSDGDSDDGVVEVVSPSELMRRVASNGVWAVGCTCDTPGAGAGAGKNGYSCTDGTRAFCASDEACFAALEFAKGDWRSGCGKPTEGQSVEA